MIKRIYHHYEKWEAHKGGLYAMKVSNPDELLSKSMKLLSDFGMLKEYMLRSITDWPCSTEMNMSNRSRNRQAWLGQAACCLFCGSPEFVTKQAWNMLTDDVRISANGVADQVIDYWENLLLPPQLFQ